LLRTKLAKVTLGLGAATLLTGCAGDAAQSALSPAGPYAQQPHDLIKIVFAIALVVFILVQGLIIYSIVKFRQRRDDDGTLPVQVHGNTRLEILWTVIPALILAGIAVPTVKGVSVEAKVQKQGRARKVIVFKYRPKARWRKKKGHRQRYTEVEIANIRI
jgi:cytochrome c oxidase subunit 2